MKSAFVHSVSAGYLPGTCGMLCQLKELGHTEDVWILYWDDIPVEKLREIVEWSGYPGRVSLRSIHAMSAKSGIEVPSRARRGWETRFYQFDFVCRELGDVDVVCFWGGDLLPLWRLDSHLRLARNFIVVSNNAYSKTRMGTVAFGSLDNDNANPYCDVPFITSDKELIWRMWELGQRPDVLSKGRGDMRCLYDAVDDLGLHRWVWRLPYSCWVHPWRFYDNFCEWPDGGFGFPDGVRIFCAHSKLWSLGHCETEARRYSVPVEKLNMFRRIYERAGEVCGLNRKVFR